MFGVSHSAATRHVLAVSCITALLAGAAQAAPLSPEEAIAQADALAREKGHLTEAEIAALKTSWTDEKAGKSLVFEVEFGMNSMDPRERKRYRMAGDIPIRLTASLYEVKEVWGRKLRKRLDGSAKFYVLGPEGDEVFKKTVSLAKLCPS